MVDEADLVELVAALDEAEIVIVGESGEPLSLATEEAAEVLSDPDPYLCSVASVNPATDINCVSYVGIVNGINPLQRAVNDAQEGYFIYVEPGTYGTNQITSAINPPGGYVPPTPHWAPNDQYAPALIVSINNLTLIGLDGNGIPGDGIGDVIIESTHNFWSNPVAVQASTGGTWNGSAYVGADVNPVGGTTPAAVIIVASGVTLNGFTIYRPNTCVAPFDCFKNVPGVLIGGLYAGDDTTAATGTVHDNVVSENAMGAIGNEVWQGVYIYNSDDNIIEDNVVIANPIDNWAAISIYDGWDGTPVNSSQGNIIRNNTLTHGISVGAWPGGTDNSDTEIIGNTTTRIMIGYSNSDGLVISDNILTGGKIENSGASATLKLTNLTVANNYIPAGSGNGIQLFWLDGASIFGNMVSGRSANGIAVLNSANVDIFGNTVESNTASGIVLVGSTLTDIHHNNVLNNIGNAANPGGITIREGNTEVNVFCNTISGNTVGIALGGGDPAYQVIAADANILAFNNFIFGNGIGIKNNTTYALDANDNYWGGTGFPGDPGSDTKLENPGIIETVTCWLDVDGDGLFDVNYCNPEAPLDNCPEIANQDQLDSDGDGLGNACDSSPFGPPDEGEDTTTAFTLPVNALNIIPVSGVDYTAFDLAVRMLMTSIPVMLIGLTMMAAGFVIKMKKNI